MNFLKKEVNGPLAWTILVAALSIAVVMINKGGV